MTKRRMGNYLSTSRFKGLELFAKETLTAWELGEKMWPGHKMAKVNGRAIVRELLLGEYITRADLSQAAQPNDGGDPVKYRAAAKAASILENPPWLCRYCRLDTTDSMKRLWYFPCNGCSALHQVCRLCRKQLLKAYGEFPYKIKLRGCPGTIAIVPEKQKKKKEAEPQQELAT